MIDAGVCETATYDSVLGTLQLMGTTTVVQNAALPAGITNIGIHNGIIYGITETQKLRRLGTLPTLSPGPDLANIVAPADRDAGLVFTSGYLVSNGAQLLAGYTKSGFPAPGTVAVFQVEDAGIRYVSAPGNYTASVINSDFLINSTDLENTISATAAIYALPGNASQTGFQLATFPGSGNSSGYTAATSSGVLLLGYADSTYQNIVKAIPVSTYAQSLANRSSFMIASAVEVVSGFDIADLTTVGDDVIVLKGGYDTGPFTTEVDRIPLTIAGSGVQTVTVGASAKIINAPNKCTRVLWTVGSGSSLFVGVEDKNGRRLVKLGL